ncbi:uncharacterized protein LOC141696082 [Apium graveolens]|uniref:uncharacterized protein LOC141696082 n=1 Tax=Apium graveolens TaxID=4045 RepID=UPI003D792C4A
MDNITRMIFDIICAEEEEHEARMRMATTYLHHRQQITNLISHHGGSTINNRMINRNKEEGHTRLYQNYFSDTPTYTETQFRRRFQMRKSLFLRIEQAVVAHDNYFTQQSDAVGVPGLSSLQKVTAALRMLAYGTAADSIDDYVCISEKYLRRPNNEDVSKLLVENAKREFPGMLGSIDYMHWKWQNCPTGWQDRSHLFEELAEGRGPQVKYTISGNNKGYYLADGIYPSWPIFVKTITKPQDNKRKYFATAQESVRKDVERAFGVLQS